MITSKGCHSGEQLSVVVETTDLR